MKHILLIILAIVLIALIALAIYLIPTLRNLFSYSQIDHDPHLTIMMGYGGNSIMLTSANNDSALIVDTKMAGGAKKIEQLIESRTPGADLTIVNTHFHNDHSGGNRRFSDARIIAGAYNEEDWKKETGMHRAPDVSLAAGEERILRFGDEIVHVRNMGRGHSWNDVVVYLENRKILVTGDLFFNGWHPALLPDNGASVHRWIAILDTLITDYDVDKVIPGHGPVCDKEGLIGMKAYFVSAGNAIGNEKLREELEKKYSDYFCLPMTSSMDKTISFIADEREDPHE